MSRNNSLMASACSGCSNGPIRISSDRVNFDGLLTDCITITGAAKTVGETDVATGTVLLARSLAWGTTTCPAAKILIRRTKSAVGGESPSPPA